ncbi:MAG: DUF3037 domain-containing protein [Filimonas sp.]|nr:DUF3037 domain-containing protein [Filimonas sp.]
MQDSLLFEYAVIRVVPRVEREEFLNVGVVLYCRKLNYLKAIYTLNEGRLQTFCSAIDIPQLKEYLHAFDQISAGAPDSGPIGKLDAASRFRWLTATRSTILQTSKVHSGLSVNPEETLQKLHAQLVL